ncbi:phosphotransferase [Bradyrhizobium sp. 187]|uniref:phosphotransferase n=1 Tax=Bradyrhizobium sp. 187 TaxID=2782655 RepID=UPI001FFFC3FA|nr:phosphotransferase [Bradyrhizobium sp. 187]
MIKAEILRPNKLKSRYAEDACRLGITAGPAAILGQLRGSNQRYRTAPAHGDLHGENVRVRNDHAIVIDFASVVTSSPLVDLAALETWLAFQLPPECDPSKYEMPCGLPRSTVCTLPWRSFIRQDRAIPRAGSAGCPPWFRSSDAWESRYSPAPRSTKPPWPHNS